MRSCPPLPTKGHSPASPQVRPPPLPRATPVQLLPAVQQRHLPCHNRCRRRCCNCLCRGGRRDVRPVEGQLRLRGGGVARAGKLCNQPSHVAKEPQPAPQQPRLGRGDPRRRGSSLSTGGATGSLQTPAKPRFEKALLQISRLREPPASFSRSAPLKGSFLLCLGHPQEAASAGCTGLVRHRRPLMQKATLSSSTMAAVSRSTGRL